MALATSGQLTLGEIAEEFGGSAPHALSEYYAGGDNVAAGAQNGGGQALPTSGEIKISDFYGAQSFGSYTLQYYVIGGGGTGGSSYGGGGGGGGSPSTAANYAVNASGQTINITVGGGGASDSGFSNTQAQNTAAENGSDSSLGGVILQQALVVEVEVVHLLLQIK